MTILSDEQAYLGLCAGVLKQAAADYKRHPKMRGEIIRFVKSDWFEIFTDIPREVFMEALNKSVKKKTHI